eukprot:GGOE01001994.1.p1 GENE.GGOE01001994.1~~GGOE01001994.1.p1  ORF type:complete len:764 (+),score=168.10 GGOE01001994.1:32-2293(+)
MAPRSTRKRHKSKVEDDDDSTSDTSTLTKESGLALASEEDASEEEEEAEEEEADLNASPSCPGHGPGRRRKRGRRKSHRDVDPAKGNIYSLKHEFRGKGIGWNICDHCGQATSVELPHALAKPKEKWNCSMNVWNPTMARCCSQADWERLYRQFMEKQKRQMREWVVQGKRVNKWWLYNSVTQMGGWETVKYNGWLPLLYDEMSLTVSDAGNRLKRIYETDLLDFEARHFRGKRYHSPEERCKLFRDTSPAMGTARPRLMCNPTSEAYSAAPDPTRLPLAPRRRALPGGAAEKAVKFESDPAKELNTAAIVCRHDYSIVLRSGDAQHSYPVVYRSRGFGYCGKWFADKHLAEADAAAKVCSSQKAWVLSRLLNYQTALPRCLLLATVIIAKGSGSELVDAESLEVNLDGTLQLLEAEGLILLQDDRVELCDAVHATCSIPLCEPRFSKSWAAKTIHRLPHFKWKGKDLLQVAYLSAGHGFTGVWEIDAQLDVKSPKQRAGQGSSCLKAGVLNYLLHCEGCAAEGESVARATLPLLKTIGTSRLHWREPRGSNSAMPDRTILSSEVASLVPIICELEEESVVQKRISPSATMVLQVSPQYIDLLAHAAECGAEPLAAKVLAHGRVHHGTPCGSKVPPSLCLSSKLPLDPIDDPPLFRTALWFADGEECCGAAGEVSMQSSDHGVVHAIDRLLGHGVRAGDGALFFHVKWKGGAEEEATWESESTLAPTAGPLLDLYWRLIQQPHSPHQRTRHLQ